MPSPTPPVADSHQTDLRHRLHAWMPSRKALWIAAAAFASGLLLFLLVWLQVRPPADDGPVVEARQSAQGTMFTPLPTPLPAGSDTNASGMDPDAEAPPPQPREVAARPPPPPAAPPPTMPSAPASPGPASDIQPQPIQAPPPVYPRAAQRRGESGTVLLRIYVSADGRVERTELLQSSHSRLLDRAASDAVRRWRFRPAMRAGQPVPGTVMVPFDFAPGR